MEKCAYVEEIQQIVAIPMKTLLLPIACGASLAAPLLSVALRSLHLAGPDLD